MRRIFIFLSLFTFFFAQSQKSVFYSDKSDKSLKLNNFGLEVYNLNFIKNNEYFNYIADGYTLLGSQLQPEFIYNASSNTQFRVGVFLLKNFGTPNVSIGIPVLSFNYFKGHHTFSIGNLYARNNHNLIEPIMASEKILTSGVLENGVEYIFDNNNVNFDFWLNWENYIKKNDNDREVFTLGVSGSVLLLKQKKHEISLPVQFIYYHKGGQINKKYRVENNLDSILNFQNKSLGIKYKYLINYSTSLGFEYYYLNQKIGTLINEFPFKSGYAHYFIASLISKKIEFKLTYFTGNKFISAKGNDIFQSYSKKINNNYWNGVLDNRYVNHTEPRRKLLFAKFIYKKTLSKAITLGFQGEGYYQLNDAVLNSLPFLKNKKNNFDYNYGIYLIFDDVFSFK